MAELSAVERGLRVELAELRARVAERDRVVELLSGENSSLREQLTQLSSQVGELQARLGQSPRNSHKPPSSEGYDKPAPRSRRERTERRSGGQPGHEGRTLAQVAVPDERVTHRPRRCGCGRSLRHAPVVSVEHRQVVDLPQIRPLVTDHAIEHRRCRCGAVNMAGECDGVPAGVGAPVSYGPGVRALATYLLAAQHLPLARTAELMSDLLDLPVSQGSLTTWYAAAAAGLDPFLDAVKNGLAGAPVLGADETGARVEGKLAWIHTARTDELTFYDVFTGPGARGAPAMRQMGLLDALEPTTVLVSDFWGPYWQFDVVHAVCGAHLLRELTAAADIDAQQRWAHGLDRLLCEINRTVTDARGAGVQALHPDLLATYRARYDTLIATGWAANPDYQPNLAGEPKKNKDKRPKHVNLLNRLDTHRDEVLRFSSDFRVPMTNNGSERDIRPVKIRLKVSGCLRTLTGAKAFCRLRSYLSTARKQEQSALAALRQLHEGNPWLPAAAS